MTKLYRICTEQKNVKQVEAIVNNHFQGFSIYFGRGYWQGTREDSMTIEIVGSEMDYLRVREIATAIKTFNGQEAVLVQTLDIESELI
jgi:hypothetical protein